MPHATAGAEARPFDVAEAIERAAHCRAARERAGLSRDALARLLGVSERSINRWESHEGAGSCPDDVLELLEALLDRQDDLTARAVARAVTLAGAADHPAGLEPRTAPTSYELRNSPRGYEVAPCKPGVYTEGPKPKPDLNRDGPEGPDATPSGPRFDAGEADSMPGGGGSMPWGGRFDAMGATVRLLYYPSQRVYDECHPKDKGHYGVANANARAVAQELERLGFTIEWRYATPELVAGFEYEFI